jgi:hypothetical protein
VLKIKLVAEELAGTFGNHDAVRKLRPASAREVRRLALAAARESAASRGLYAAGLLPSMPIIGNLPAVCARPANGHAAAPPTSMMNERRFS